MPFPFLAAATMLAPVVGGLLQSRHNKSLARFQNEYNSPASQMARFKEAGLNPNLVYTQGNSGNMSPITPTNWQSAVGDAPARFTQSELAQTQADVGQQKIEESQTKQQLMMAQRDVLKANPFLSERYVNAMITTMEATAKQKKHDVDFMTSEQAASGATTYGQAKIQLDLNALAERTNLMVADKEQKAQILQSEKFRTELLEVQRNWLKEKQITPQHIYQGIMLMLSKLM